MVGSRWFSSSRLFLGLGIALVVLAFVSFPIRIPLQAQPGDVEYYRAGWLFAPIVGVWGLASAVLGLVQSSLPKNKIETYLLPVLAVDSVGLAYAGYLAVVFGSGIIRSVGRGEPFFWVYFGLFLVPSVLIYAFSIRFMRAKERTEFLRNKRWRATAFVLLAAVPLSYTAGFLLILYLL
ncbi:MAG: hypothetical protein NWF05_05715 [Candidatus Bathyarchaeota archaeon]|nr:hypothetical protein [Candidatus Bathyarchaeota archaeon]